MDISPILSGVLAGESLSPEVGIALLQVGDPVEVEAIRRAADQLRRILVGDRVTYVINRNLNFTNICEQHCGFCAFRRDPGEAGAFWLTAETMIAKVQEAVSQGATEICMQGGLNPAAKIGGSSLAYYERLIRQLKEPFPQIHIHAFSPQEIAFIAREDGIAWETVLQTLQGAGLGSLPGTAAEVLDDRLRQILCPEKLDSQTWCAILAMAHRLGLCTTSTMLCGHLETPAQQIAHFEQLRQLQRRAIAEGYPGRITEFILLPFVGAQAPAPLRRRVGRDQPDLAATLHLTAVARLYFGLLIPHHQPSWVKLGLAGAAQALHWGCDDLGGTLMEEHITSMAGAIGGTAQTVASLARAIGDQGSIPQQRDTLYRAIEAFPENRYTGEAVALGDRHPPGPWVAPPA